MSAPDLRALTDAVLQRAVQVQDRADELRMKLSKRQGRPGFSQNTAEIEAALSEEQSDDGNQEG